MFIHAVVFGLATMLFSHFWFPVSVEETLWWHLMCCGTYFNVMLLSTISPTTNDEKKQKYLSSLFLLSTSIRSLFPRIDVERICYFDTFISTTIVGRTLATVGEVAFSLQISLAMLRLMKELDVRSFVPYVITPAITVAQVLCWCGVLTTNQLFHCFEESIWTIFMFLLIPLTFRLMRKTECNKVYYKLMGCMTLLTIYVIYMAFIDVPMYYKRYIHNEKQNVSYLSLKEGIADSTSCKVVTQSYYVWKEDSIWMIGYFIFCSLISIGLIKSKN